VCWRGRCGKAATAGIIRPYKLRLLNWLLGGRVLFVCGDCVLSDDFRIE